MTDPHIIRAAIAKENLHLDEWQSEQLEEMTTRYVVEKVG